MIEQVDTRIGLRLYAGMVRIRLVEETLADLAERGLVKTPIHLYVGQEAVAVGVCMWKRDGDTIWGGHRSHGHYLAAGGRAYDLIAEVLGRATGCSAGRGGSMHVFAPYAGVYGTVPLVAATIPIATGAALASKLRGTSTVAFAFFGDGATEEGHFHESLNFAALHQLPVVFVCENNLYSSHLALLERRRADNIAAAGLTHSVPTEVVDGNDVVTVYDAAQRAVSRARSSMGPTLLECRTYRWRGHVGPSWDEDVGVCRRDELKQWLDRDPIRLLRQQLTAVGTQPEVLGEVDAEITAEIQSATERALGDPAPAAQEVLKHVFVESLT